MSYLAECPPSMDVRRGRAITGPACACACVSSWHQTCCRHADGTSSHVQNGLHCCGFAATHLFVLRARKRTPTGPLTPSLSHPSVMSSTTRTITCTVDGVKPPSRDAELRHRRAAVCTKVFLITMAWSGGRSPTGNMMGHQTNGGGASVQHAVWACNTS